MEILTRFQPQIEMINKRIVEFNSYLIEKYHIPRFDETTMSSIVKVIHRDWDSFPFPNNQTSGVYFVFGHNEAEAEQKGLYVGKASFGAKTSDRLYAHLHPNRNNEYFTMDGPRGELFIIDFIASIDLENMGINFLASALEEYLITNLLKDKLYLMNRTGNCR
jgi:hypothetical protein